MKYYVAPSLKEHKPDIIVIHVGGNDINYKNKGHVNMDELADNIISLAMMCGDFGTPDVVISEVLPKKYIAVTATKRKVSNRVTELCKNNKLCFTSHQQTSYIMMEFI